MKQIAQNYKSGGELRLIDVPARRAVAPAEVLVRTAFSAVSTGTEMMKKFTEGRLSLLGKARARPDQVAKVAHSVPASRDCSRPIRR